MVRDLVVAREGRVDRWAPAHDVGDHAGDDQVAHEDAEGLPASADRCRPDGHAAARPGGIARRAATHSRSAPARADPAASRKAEIGAHCAVRTRLEIMAHGRQIGIAARAGPVSLFRNDQQPGNSMTSWCAADAAARLQEFISQVAIDISTPRHPLAQGAPARVRDIPHHPRGWLAGHVLATCS